MQSQQIAGILLFLIGLTLSFIANLITSETKVQNWYTKNRTLVFVFGFVMLFAGSFLTLSNSSGRSTWPFFSSTAESTIISAPTSFARATTMPLLSADVLTNAIPTTESTADRIGAGAHPSEPSATAIPTIESTADAIVAVNRLNMREGPSTFYSITSSYDKGTTLRIIGKDVTAEWIKIETPDGYQGWMYTTNLQINIVLTDIPVISAPPLPPTHVPPSPVPPTVTQDQRDEPTTLNVSVSSTQGWQSTGVIIHQDQHIQIVYQDRQWAGRVGYGPSLPDIWTDAGGTDYEIFYPEIGITARFGSLIGKVGDGPVLQIGNSSDFRSNASGALSLRMHDSDGGLNDNSGSINVLIKIWP